jgi:hypothetical protein
MLISRHGDIFIIDCSIFRNDNLDLHVLIIILLPRFEVNFAEVEMDTENVRNAVLCRIYSVI